MIPGARAAAPRQTGGGAGAAFTTIGEILIDFTPMAEDGETAGFRMHAGGAPCNVAIGLARLGARVAFVGKASTDFFGRFLVGRLEQEGVIARFVSRSPAPTTLAFVALEAGSPSFSFYSAGAADTLLRPEDVAAEVGKTDVLHFGSISLIAPPTAETVLALVDRLRGRSLLSFDPNIRPTLIADPAAYRQRLDRALGAADVVKLSDADLTWLTPGRAVEDAAASLCAQGPRLVVVTLGPEGCYARTRAIEIRCPAPRVEVVDTIGAGDAFSSGLLLRLGERGLTSRSSLEDMDVDALRDALRTATAAAALTCARAGADPPRRAEVDAFLLRAESGRGA